MALGTEAAKPRATPKTEPAAEGMSDGSLSLFAEPRELAKTPAKSPKKVKKVKKVKDPNAPKRNLSAYFFFMNDQRAKVVKANPDMKVTEVGKKLGELWRAMSDSEKVPYNKKADADKIRYEKAKAAYKPK